MNEENEYKETMVGLHRHLTESYDILITTLSKHQQKRVQHTVLKEAYKYLKETGEQMVSMMTI